MYRAFADQGAIILPVPEDKPWDWREKAVATPEGHRSMVGRSIGPPQR